MKNISIIIACISILFFIGCEEKKVTSIFGNNPGTYAPTNLQIQRLDPLNIMLSWEDNSEGEDGFIIEKKKEEQQWELLYAILDEDTTEFFDTVDDPNSTYFYRVCAYDGEYLSLFTSTSIDMSFNGASNLHITQVNVHSVRLTWDDSSFDETGYRIDRKIENDNFQEFYAELSANSISFIDSFVIPNLFYEYRVYAVFDSTYSYYEEENIIPVINSPSDFECGQNNIFSSILSWTDNNIEESGFRIDKQQEGNDWIINYVILPENTVQFVDSLLSTGIEYNYRIYSFYDSVYSEYEEDAITLEFLSPPVNLVIEQIDLNSVIITWEDPNYGETGFRIDRKINDDEWIENYVLLPPNSESFIDTDVEIYSTYHYKICTVYQDSLSSFTEGSVNINPLIIGGCDTDNASDVFVKDYYAYVADYYYGLKVIDISNSSNPIIVGSCDMNYARDIFTVDNYAYVADSYEGLKVIDISNPSNPIIVGSCETTNATSVYILDCYAYIADQNSGLRVVDISNPFSPFIIGSCDIGLARGVYVVDNYAYVVDYYEGLKVIDITNPASPFIIGCCDMESARGVYVKDNYVYVADWEEGLKVIDITNPTSPSIVGSCDTYKAKGVYVKDNYAYVADWDEGLKVIDITNPTSPSIVGSCDTYKAHGVYVKDNNAYVADDIYGGLKIIQIAE